MSKRRMGYGADLSDGEQSFGSGLDEVGWRPQSFSSKLRAPVNAKPRHLRSKHFATSDEVIVSCFDGQDHVSVELEAPQERGKPNLPTAHDGRSDES